MDKTYDFAYMTGHAFQCLLTEADISAMLSKSHALLRENGKLFFESRNPDARTWENWSPENAGPPETLPSGRTVKAVHNVISMENELLHFREDYEFDNPELNRSSTSTLRFAPKETIVRLAAEAGFSLTNYWKDWDGESQGTEIIFELTKRQN